MKRIHSRHRLWGLAALTLAALPLDGRPAAAQTPPPTPSLVDPDLAVRTVATGLTTPIHLAFIGKNEMLVLEKNTGKVQRLVNGALASTVLDLAVNFASERGLLSIALHPRFQKNGFVYLYWTESTTGADSGVLADVPLLGNRVDRFVWNGSTLTLDRNLIRLRAFQADAGQPLRGNHNGGVIVFGPDERDGRDHEARTTIAAATPVTTTTMTTAMTTTTITTATTTAGQALHPDGRQRPARPDAEPGARPGRARRARRPVRRTRARQRPPHRRDPPAQRRRDHAEGQPVLQARRAGSAAKSERTSRRSSPTASATASAWRSIPCPATSGNRRTATTRSPSSIGSSPA